MRGAFPVDGALATLPGLSPPRRARASPGVPRCGGAECAPDLEREALDLLGEGECAEQDQVGGHRQGTEMVLRADGRRPLRRWMSQASSTHIVVYVLNSEGSAGSSRITPRATGCGEMSDRVCAST